MIVDNINAIAAIKQQIRIHAFAHKDDIIAVTAVADDPVHTGKDLFATGIDNLDRAGCDLFDDIGFIGSACTDAAITISVAHIQHQIGTAHFSQLDRLGQFQIPNGKVQVQLDTHKQDSDACIGFDVDRNAAPGLYVFDFRAKPDAGPAPVDSQAIQADGRTAREANGEI